jgi:type II secretory pathway component GspD/PulD (secretin)
MDFALRRRGGAGAIVDVIESKFARGRAQTVTEVVDDAARLESVEFNCQNEGFTRLIVVAGTDTDVNHLRQAQAIRSLLNGSTSGLSVSVADAQHAERGMWASAYQAVNAVEMPRTITSRIVADESAGRMRCCVWRINRAQNRALRAI